MTAQLNTTNYILSTSASKFEAAIALQDSYIKRMAESLQTKYLNWNSPSYAYDMAFNLIIGENELNEDQLFKLTERIFSDKHLNSNPIFSSAARATINKGIFSNDKLDRLLQVQFNNTNPNTLSIRAIIKSTSDLKIARMANSFMLNLKPGASAQYEPKKLNPAEYTLYFSEAEQNKNGDLQNYDKVDVSLLDQKTKESLLSAIKTNNAARVDHLYNIPIQFAKEALECHPQNNVIIGRLLEKVRLENNDETLDFISTNIFAQDRLSQLVYANNTAKNAIEQLLKVAGESKYNAVINSLICSKDNESNNFLLDYAIEHRYINTWAKNNDINKDSLKKIYGRTSRNEFNAFLEVVFERAYEYKMVENFDKQIAPSSYFDKEGAIRACNDFIHELLISNKISTIEALTSWPPVIVKNKQLAFNVFNENTVKLDEQSITDLAKCFIASLAILNNSTNTSDLINQTPNSQKPLLTLALSKLKGSNIKLDLESIICNIYANHKTALKITHFNDLKKLKATFAKDALASIGLSIMCHLANGKIQMSPKETHDVITTVAGIVTRVDSKDRFIGGTQFINYLSESIAKGFIEKDLAVKLNDSLIKTVTKIPLSKINNDTDILANSTASSSDKNQYPDIIANEITAAILKHKVKLLNGNEPQAIMTKQRRNHI